MDAREETNQQHIVQQKLERGERASRKPTTQSTSDDAGTMSQPFLWGFVRSVLVALLTRDGAVFWGWDSERFSLLGLVRGLQPRCLCPQDLRDVRWLEGPFGG